MHSHNLLPAPRLVASGGPVTRAVTACDDPYAAERRRIADLRDACIQRIKAEAELIDRLDCAAAALLSLEDAQ